MTTPVFGFVFEEFIVEGTAYRGVPVPVGVCPPAIDPGVAPLPEYALTPASTFASRAAFMEAT